MKKILSLMAAALVSVAMWAGENDLLWDYTQAQIPTTSPDSTTRSMMPQAPTTA